VSHAIAQLAGTRVVPVAFSFGRSTLYISPNEGAVKPNSLMGYRMGCLCRHCPPQGHR
jgi:hypothetical protein